MPRRRRAQHWALTGYFEQPRSDQRFYPYFSVIVFAVGFYVLLEEHKLDTDSALRPGFDTQLATACLILESVYMGRSH